MENAYVAYSKFAIKKSLRWKRLICVITAVMFVKCVIHKFTASIVIYCFYYYLPVLSLFTAFLADYRNIKQELFNLLFEFL